jgi:hypothetical protein
MDEEEPTPPPSKPSQIPSWVTLGFVLGAGFVLALPRRATAPLPVPAEPRPVVKYVAMPRMTTIEAVFAEWGKYAVWDNDITEVGLWNADTKEYSDLFEVLRVGDATYFRSIPRFTRLPLIHGVKPGSPLQFTETEAQRQEWLRAKDDETWGALRGAANSAK